MKNEPSYCIAIHTWLLGLALTTSILVKKAKLISFLATNELKMVCKGKKGHAKENTSTSS
jgi:hypothetical protein